MYLQAEEARRMCLEIVGGWISMDFVLLHQRKLAMRTHAAQGNTTIDKNQRFKITF